jgi:hypothetical protein
MSAGDLDRHLTHAPGLIGKTRAERHGGPVVNADSEVPTSRLIGVKETVAIKATSAMSPTRNSSCGLLLRVTAGLEEKFDLLVVADLEMCTQPDSA